MYPHHERAVRIDLSFPLTFLYEDVLVRGICDNVSESGLLATFEYPLDVWITGQVDLHCGSGLFGLHARVARTVGFQAGLAFQKNSTSQRIKLEELIAASRSGIGY